jgi:hypothetical protein
MPVAATIVNAVRLMAYEWLHVHDHNRILLVGGRFLSLEWTD